MACSKDYVEDIVGGYDFKLVNENKDIILECPICLLLLREAMGTQCSHLFCKSCLQRLTRQVDVRNIKYQCPDCQQIVNETLPNAFVNRLVTGSDVYCQQNKTGCLWKGSVASYFEKHDRECGYKIVECKNGGCVISCERRNLQDHVLECEYRIVECEHCTVELKVIELDKHYFSCVRFPTVCPHDECGSIVPKTEMEEHLDTRCEFVIVNCQYATFGCLEKMTRRDMEKHNQSSTNNHMNLMFNQIVQSKNEIDDLRQENTKSRNKIDGLQQKFVNTRKENANFRNEIDKRKTETENRLDEQRREIEKQKNEIEKHKKEIKELKEQLKNKVDKETACSKNPPSATSSFNIDEVLSKGAEKWIRKKDVQCFGLDYKNWYTKIFDLMKESKLYKFDSVMYVKIKNEERKKQVIWCSNNRKNQNTHAARNDVFFHGNDLVLWGNAVLVISTETLKDYNKQNESTALIIHPQHQENMIRLQIGCSDNDTNQWFIYAVPDDFNMNNFLIICLAKFA